jgi:tRNA threonylcarbamoyladenosine biosynthesis protein TsaB
VTVYLVIDTATHYGAVGIWIDHLVRTSSWLSRHSHTSELMPAVDAILSAEGVTVSDLDGIAVTVGPGGFSALRAGLGVAKGLALSRSLPVVGVSTLEATAYPHRHASERVCAVLSAGRDLVAWAAYGRSGEAWSALTEETVTSVPDLLSAQTTETLFCGEAITALVSERGSLDGPRLIADASPLVRLGGVAGLGAARLAAGDLSDMASIEPRYLRPPTITAPAKPKRII